MDYNTGTTSTSSTTTRSCHDNPKVNQHFAVQLDDADGVSSFSKASTFRSKAGVTPMALIVTRNVQKFFANKILQQENKQKNLSPSNATGSTTENGNHHPGMDVGAVLHDVDEILDHRSIEDGRLLLRGMVADLLKELDVLRYKYDTLQEQYVNVKEERDVVNHIYNDKIETLTLTLQNAVQQSSSTNNHKKTTMTSNTSHGGSSSNRDATASYQQLSTEWKQRMEEGKTVSAEVATTLTIQALMEKMEILHVQTLQQQDTILQLQEQIEDLSSDNDAKTYKIMALEQQFTHINQKRTKVITKFGNPKHSNNTTGSNNTSMILRPLRLNHHALGMDTTPTTTTTPKTSNPDRMGHDDDPPNNEGTEENDVSEPKEDYNSIYQDHKENIIANIFIQHHHPPSPIVVASTTTTTNHKIETPTTMTMTTTGPKENDVLQEVAVMEKEETPVVNNVDITSTTTTSVVVEKEDSPRTSLVIDHEEQEVATPPQSVMDNNTATTASSLMEIPMSSPTFAIIDRPDDEIPNEKENHHPTMIPQDPSPTMYSNHYDDKNHRMIEMTTAPSLPAMVTPPTKHRGTTSFVSKKTTTLVLEDHTKVLDRQINNNNSESSRHNVMKQSSVSSVVGKTKSRHSGPRAPRLVQLVEQV